MRPLGSCVSFIWLVESLERELGKRNETDSFWDYLLGLSYRQVTIASEYWGDLESLSATKSNMGYIYYSCTIVTIQKEPPFYAVFLFTRGLRRSSATITLAAIVISFRKTCRVQVTRT